MTTTKPNRAEINLWNSRRSTGPTSPEGKQQSKFNAVKHGMTAVTPVLPGEDLVAFHRRLDDWAEALEPDDVVEQFLVERAVTASWKIERAGRVEIARLAAAVRDAAAEQQLCRREETDRLGAWLLRDGDQAADPDLAKVVLQILTNGANDAIAVSGIDHPRKIVGRLETTAEGCAWLLDRWAELRAPLEQGLDWNEDQLVQAVQLSGRQPLDLTPEVWEVHVEDRYFEDDEEPESSGDAELDEEQQEAVDGAISAEVEAEDRRKLGAQLLEDLPEDEVEARAALLGVVERTSGRLTELAAVNADRAEAEAAERAQRLSFDAGAEGERLRQYQFGCERSLRRTLDTLLKLRRAGRGHERSDRGAEDRGSAPPGVRDEGTAPDFALILHQNEAIAPDVAPTLDQIETNAPDLAPPSLQNEAIAPDVAPPSLQNEAIAPDAAPPSLQNEARTPTEDHSSPKDEVIAPAEGTARPVPAAPFTALALLSLLVFASLATAFGGSAEVLGRIPHDYDGKEDHRRTNTVRSLDLPVAEVILTPKASQITAQGSVNRHPSPHVDANSG